MSQRVCYLYNEDITKYEFSKEHPMKTKRIKMAHSLIHSYHLAPLLKVYHPKQATSQDMAAFHNPIYLKYLETWVSPTTKPIILQYTSEQELMKAKNDDGRLAALFKVNQSFDCPGFEGLFEFCRLAAGSSIDAADLVIAGEGDVVINWSGGFHHAKKSEASGFCYINDIVLCILELLKVYPRVLYLDIDVHHGDGVQEAFYHTNRVMTVSFHEYDEDFFPGTGALNEIGKGAGKFFTVNVPLKKGINDEVYLSLFKKVMGTVMSHYVPDVVVIQCGADSLSKDKLGHLNLSIRGHGELITYMKSFGMPLILLGGGGYTI